MQITRRNMLTAGVGTLTVAADGPQSLKGTSMPKSCTHRRWRSPSLPTGLLLCLFLSLSASMADTVPPTKQSADVHPEMQTVLSSGMSVAHYPSKAPALITAVELAFQPGQQTGWHTHPVPLFGYMLEGELTVDYGTKGVRIYRKGDALIEAVNEAHNGRNTGQSPAKILAVFVGMEGLQGSVPASPPAR